MVDKIVELLQGLKEDVGELRTDVYELSNKVDHLSHKSQDNVIQKNVVQSTKENIKKNSNYGRDLSDAEQLYINKLHSEDTNKNAGVNIQGKMVNENLSETAPIAPKATQFQTQNTQFTKVHKKSVIERFFSWLAKDWPMKVGGFFVIAAIGWFVTYAASVGWLSEVARVVLGYCAAICAIAFGSMRAEKERTQGNLFLIIGIAAMLISSLAGIYYEIMIPVVGMFVMLISVGFVTLVSLKQKSISLTASMIFFGAIIPLFFALGVTTNTIFVYLFILTLGTLWVVAFTSWRGLTTMMLAIVGFYSITYIATEFGNAESMSNIILAFIFAGIFYGANISSIIKSEKTNHFDIMTALGIGTLMLIWILSFASAEFEVILLLIAILFFAGASYVIFVKTGRKAPTAIYGGVTATLFAVATALQFDGPVLITAYLVESSAIAIITLYFARKGVNSTMRSLLTIVCAVPVIMSLVAVAEIFSYLDYPDKNSVLNYMPELFTVFMVCITMFSVAVAILRVTDISNKENMIFFRIFAYTGGAFGLMLIWFVTHLFMGNDDIATFTALVTYTVVGVGFYVMGIKEEYKPYRIVGGILFGIVVARVLFIEFWDMDIIMRIITSFVLGTLLISTAFIKKAKK
ncbi:MAG: DUF2339 domain-containing protein [Candidatus Moraniibacteriota bacterium]